MKKVNVGIIGTGNIGIDLLVKVMRSEVIQCTVFSGRRPESKGLEIAAAHNIPVACNSIQYFMDHPDCCDIVFDATSATAHRANMRVFNDLNKFVIDLTPSGVGTMCVPILNLEECMYCSNVNLVSCGCQAVTPIARAILNVHPETRYIETVSSISSKSAGDATRRNIDDFTQKTKEAVIKFSGVPEAKSIIILNPAEPPINMHNTVYAKVDRPDLAAIENEVSKMVDKIRAYLPGYQLLLGPISDGERVTVMMGLEGLGDYLPKYAGNLDIITSAAVKVAESWAVKYCKGGDYVKTAAF